ncbi:MAG: hypothetical protein HYU69_00825 [Bacteroidetes bacterium]|nr:hypothetical protein [Bacteroidota bacterium]
MRIHFSIFFTLFTPLFLQAAQFAYPVGARSGALGNTSVIYSDVWSAFNNQAGLAFVKDISAGVNYENRFLISELSLRSVAAVLPFKGTTTFGISASSLGYHLYSENKYGLAIAKSFGEKISAGVQIDYLKAQIAEGYSSKGIMTIEMGMLFKPIKDLIIGAHVFNPVRSRLNDYNDERVATIMKIGASYLFSEKVLLAVEVNKRTDEQPQFRTGLEYFILKNLYLRAGIGTNPSSISFGAGLSLKQVKIDLSSSYHQVLGYTPQIAIVYVPKHE